MLPEEKQCLEGAVYVLMYLFIFLLLTPILIRFMDDQWSKWVYCGFAGEGLLLVVRLRILLNQLR